MGSVKVTLVFWFESSAVAFGATKRQSAARLSPVPIPLSSFICLRYSLRLTSTAVMMQPLYVVGLTRDRTPENPAAGIRGVSFKSQCYGIFFRLLASIDRNVAGATLYRLARIFPAQGGRQVALDPVTMVILES